MKKVIHLHDPDAVLEAFRPFLDLDLVAWQGLPGLTVETLTATFGEAAATQNVELGFFPALRHHYETDSACGGFSAYTRNGEVMLVEAVKIPPISLLNEIGEPDAILPNELLEENAYVHEYLYCERGLVLSVAESFDRDLPSRIVRCRGIRPLDGPRDFGPDLYMPFEDRIVW